LRTIHKTRKQQYDQIYTFLAAKL